MVVVMGTDAEGRTTVFNGGGYVTTIGRDIAHHSLYPSDYTPKRVTQRRLFQEFLDECKADVLGHKWFWTWVVLAVGYLGYHVIAFAVNQPWAMRIK